MEWAVRVDVDVVDVDVVVVAVDLGLCSIIEWAARVDVVVVDLGLGSFLAAGGSLVGVFSGLVRRPWFRLVEEMGFFVFADGSSCFGGGEARVSMVDGWGR